MTTNLQSSIKKANEKVEKGEFKSLVVCGDFNFPGIDWPESGVWESNGGLMEEEFFEGTDDCFLTQVVHESTFGADGKGGNILDLVFVSDPERLLELTHEPPLGYLKKGHAVIIWKACVG